MINFLKRNWALLILIIIGVLYLKNYYQARRYSLSTLSHGEEMAIPPLASDTTFSSKRTGIVSNYPERQVAPTENVDRMIIQYTNLSLQVKDVAKTIDDIENKTKEFGGFLVNSNLSKTGGGVSGFISVRIPEIKRKEVMDVFKKMAVKVVSESVNGTDVTDQYTDLQAQLDVLQKTKIKFEEILNRATAINDLLNVQQQLISLQSQIDSVKGQQKYYEQSEKLSKISIYLSTDELALPYSPTNEWRPMVVFKEAVRALLLAFRSIGNLIIWIVVFAPTIIPLILIFKYVKRRRNINK